MVAEWSGRDDGHPGRGAAEGPWSSQGGFPINEP